VSFPEEVVVGRSYVLSGSAVLAALLGLFLLAGTASAEDQLLALRNAVGEQKARNADLEAALERLAALAETDVCKTPEASQAVLDEVSALRTAPPPAVAPAATADPAAAPDAASAAPAAAPAPAAAAAGSAGVATPAEPPAADPSQ